MSGIGNTSKKAGVAAYNLRSAKNILPMLNETSPSANSFFQPIMSQPTTEDIGIVEDSEEYTITDVMSLLKSMKPLLNKLQKLDSIEDNLKSIKDDVVTLQSNVQTIDGRVVTLEEKDRILTEKYDTALREVQVSAIRNEYNSKQFNVIISNLPDNDKYEKPETSRKEAVKVFSSVLNIDDAENINIINAHRLPKGSAKRRRPLIVKLSSMFDKKKIWDNITKLNQFNRGKTEERKIFIEMNHLPEKLKKDKDSLLEDYKKAKNEVKKPKWWYIKSTGYYCYYIDNVCYMPKTNNFKTIQH